ncbi:MAG: PTS sugar transporter subunit IIA [Chloroflexi bacterium]|nr:PTS sugar transporter subunit IIA [Chloroflexota bacterium]
MQYTLIDLLKTKHILVGLDATDAQDAIRKLTASLVETGHVTPEFADDVWGREAAFPTGLPTQPLSVAMPHADPDHVNRSAVGIGVLLSPVHFAQMGTDGSTILDVPIIFLLAIKEQEKQVEMIQQLISLIQSPSLLEGLSKARDSSEVMALIQNVLD